MSFEQESIWLNDQLQDGPSRYLESWAYRLRDARIDATAVQRALTGIVARHEALRSRLTLAETGSPGGASGDGGGDGGGINGGGARQTVMPPSPVELDVRRVTPRELPAALTAAATRPVSLVRPPLLRATLLELAEDDTVLVVAIHHAVIDGWCFGLLDTEFSALYRAALDGKPSPLPPLPLQFGPYAEEQRRAGAGGRDDSLEYWRETLRGAPGESSFPTDRPRPPVLGARGDRVEFTLGAALGAGVRGLARRTRSTPFTVLATALTVLVSRLSGQDDVVIGTPVSRRDEEILEPMIACLSDVLPLRQRIPADVSFAALTARTKERVWGAVAHRDVPYARLVRELGAERTPDRFPLFQVVFGLDDAPAPALDLPGVTAERLYIHSGTAKYDVFLHLVPARGGFDGFLEFSTDLFDRATAQRLAERLRTLLTDAVAHPDRPVRELDILPAAERRLILGNWSRGSVPAAGRPLAHEAFAAQALRTPHAAAVVHGDRVLSYAELDRAANDVAAHLVARGTAGRPVGVCLRRGPELAVAVLGVLKAGSGCLPIDPAHPADRIAGMAADSGIGIALVQRDLAALLPATVDTVSLDDLPAAPEAGLPAVAPGDLGYLIYTSGSTGRPKGVAVPHRSLANLLAWQRTRSPAGPGTRTLQFAALGFDVVFQELFATWADGGTLVMADDATRRDPGRLLDLLAAERVERLFLPFVALQQLAEYACAADRPAETLREVVTAGEQLHATPALREFFRRLAPNAVLENQYGPSETHVVTAERLGHDPEAWPDLPPIGRPVDGTRVLLLDGNQRLGPIGAVGEICVGGDALADGYLGHPSLTERKFIEDPVRPGARLYRTGDLARYLPDGRIQWLGRLDDQVKIRGHRVEIGEVASAVRAVPGVADAAVVAREPAASGSGHKRLIAYYLPAVGPVGGRAAGAAPGPDELRRALALRLPEYMVPSVCVALEEFPRTASGKLDRAALPLPEEADASPADSFVAPGTPTERLVAAAWQDVLGRGRVGVHDDFFALGGYSLSAVRLILRLRQDLGTRIPLGALSTAPTVAGLAALVDRDRDRDRDRSRDRDRTAGWDAGDRGFDPAAEVRLPADIVAAGETIRVAEDPAHVLLTGATGFLGAFTVRALLDRTRAVVHCLVRGEDEERASARLRRVMEGYGILNEGDEGDERRVRIVVGDLARPRLGLSEQDFDALAHTVDAVYHVGAAVNLASPYGRLKAATVDGTAEILRLAARHRSVPVHHVSTVGVYASGAGATGHVGETGYAGERIGPERPTGPAEALEHGYTQSKWAAEQLIEAARARSLPATVYRPTRIAGHSRTGACQSGDYMWLIVKGCIQAQAAPAGVDTAFDLVPVDYAGDALVALSLRPSAAGRTFHLAAGRLLRLDTVLGWLRAKGYALPAVDPRQWLDRIGADAGNAAFPLLGTLAGEMTGGGSEGGLLFDPGATDTALAGSGVRRPEMDEELFATYLGYFTRTGWLLEPGER
ncbi:amino acid adenylation domain-containing protein [Streptomyces paludis]|uniref:Amino acid adenylation domain-containing protein n=2 Tax=Streptomyces paludis TaxID=2282738 RepID=A0A345HY16_9ACTN|nr:amino acid adenylation domain-containing protein [Streptomyces paludis]